MITTNTPQGVLMSEAISIARQLIQNPAVKGIELFGSLAKGTAKEGSDIDLIVLVDDRISDLWMNSIWTLGDDNVNAYTSAKWQRLEAAMTWVYDQVLDSTTANIDVFLFPEEWRDFVLLDYLQRMGRHHDPMFMSNLAREAITFDPEAGSFFQPR